MYTPYVKMAKIRAKICYPKSYLIETRLVEITQNCIAENARIAQDQGEYQKRYNGLVERYEKAKARFDEVTDTIAQRSAKGERLAGFIRTLEAQGEPVAEFDERLWGAMVDYVTVGVDGGMTVVFRDGMGMSY